MKTIKINNNTVPDEFKDTRLVRVKDVLKLIRESPPMISSTAFKQWLEERIEG